MMTPEQLKIQAVEWRDKAWLPGSERPSVRYHDEVIDICDFAVKMRDEVFFQQQEIRDLSARLGLLEAVLEKEKL